MDVQLRPWEPGELPQILRQARLDAGVSLDQVAQAMAVMPRRLEVLEKGRPQQAHHISWATILAWCNALGFRLELKDVE